MKNLTSDQLRSLYLKFFEERGHKVIPSASLIPENDPSVLFTTAGMHPLVPYLMGQEHPAGKRLTDVQKCLRTGDIDEVGDASHCTFFEMLGNWSLGDYFKHESIAWSYELLTSEEWLGIDKDRLYFTCFEGDENAPRDTESHDRWVEMGVDPSHIFYLGAKHNWWIPGNSGPAARIRRFSSIPASPSAALSATLPATAASTLKYGTTFSCSIIRTPKAT